MSNDINELYGKIYRHNQSLLNLSGSNYSTCSCADAIDLYITSHALSFLRDIKFELFQSHGFIFNARCIIEGIAVKRYCQSTNKALSIELLKKQTAILEYRYYSQLKGIIDYIVMPEKLKSDYDEAVSYYHSQLKNYSDTRINEIIKSQIPFLLDPKTNYRKIVGEQLGEDFAKLYGVLSQMIHPSLNDVYSRVNELQLPIYVLELIENEYGNLRRGQYNLEYHCNVSLSSPVPQKLGSLVYDECEIIINISNVIQSYFDKNYISDTLQTLYLLLKEMMLDTLMGLREQTKSKQKLFLDLISVFHEVQMKDYPEEQMKLLSRHAEIQRARNIGNDFNTDDAFDIYKSIYQNAIDKSVFDSAFLSMTGYLIDEKGHAKSLTKVAKDYLSRFDHAENEIKISQVSMLDYLESQMLSHANGYMFFANSGAWSEVNNILVWSDYFLADILQTVLSIYKSCTLEEDKKKFKPFINMIRNGIKKIKEISVQKSVLLSIPTQNLNSVM